jgi:hypothetical protein
VPESSCLLDRAKGSASRVVYQDEPCWGDPDYEDQQPRGVDFVNESVRNTINRIESQIIRSNRQRQKAQQGNNRPGGDLNGELQPNTWPNFLRHALCRSTDVDTVGSGPYTHTFVGGTDLDDGITLEKRWLFRDSEDLVLQFIGCRVNEFYFSIPTEGIVTCRAGLLAKRRRQVFPGSVVASEGSIEDIRSAEYATENQPFNSFHAALEVDGSPIVTVTNLDFLLNNNMDGEAFALTGQPYRADLSEADRAISGNMNVFFTKSTFEQFYDAFADNLSISLRITLERGDQSIVILLPQITIGGDVDPATASKAPLNLSMTYDAHEDEDSGNDIEVTVVNNDATLTTAA